MSWFESKGEEAFRAALLSEKFLLSNPGCKHAEAMQSYNMKLEKIELSEKFLQSICELKKLTHTSTHQFYEKFLFAGAAILRERNKGNYEKLDELYSKFAKNIVNSDVSHMSTGSKNLFWHSFRLTLNLGGIAAGGAVLHIAVWGTASLAMGPWGVAALGIAIGLVGLLFAIYELYNIYQNARLFRNSQFNEITAFVTEFEHLNGDREINTNPAENNLEINSTFDTYETPQGLSATSP